MKKRKFTTTNINQPKIGFIKFRWWLLKVSIKLLVILWTVFLIILWAQKTVPILKETFKKVSWLILEAASKTIGQAPKEDELWNINFLIAGVWWAKHDWGWLTDTIMIGSFSPKYKTLTFLSIPRDLYVKIWKNRYWRINTIFANQYLKTKSIDLAANALKKKVSQITGIPLNYYLIVDFNWFIKFVDNIWWLDIYVPQPIIDYRYPGPNWTYTVFKIDSWWQHLNWQTALKYARSRHSTSDFSRSFRQQQIIKAILNKLISSDIVTSPSKLKSLYLQVQDTVYTDLSFKEILWFVPYIKKTPKIFSYVLNADCYMTPNTYWKNLTPGCFVYPANKKWFNWQAVLLPVGSTPEKIENYKEIQKFAFVVINYPELHLENSKIQILNWIDKKVIRRYYKGYLKPVASLLAYKLKNYWFNIEDVWNASKYYNKSILYHYDSKPVTIQLLKIFVWDFSTYTWSVKYAWKWYDMTLILWKDYLLK